MKLYKIYMYLLIYVCVYLLKYAIAKVYSNKAVITMYSSSNSVIYSFDIENR